MSIRSKTRTLALALAAGLAAVLWSGPAALAAGKRATLDPANPDDQLRMQVKISCSLVEGRPTLYWWSGRMWARVPGEANRLLFEVHGMNVRQCRTKQDPVRGFCYRSVSREVMFYVDPGSGEIARRWKNPWTGEEVDVVQVANDPVNARDWICSRDADGKPLDRGDTLFVKDDLLLEGGSAARLFYKNPLGGEYQDYVGGAYHAMEFGTSAAAAREALDPRDTELQDAVLSWGRISRWLPWMKMGDREGQTVLVATWQGAASIDELPEPLRGLLKSPEYALYATAPPLDDARPSVFSWDGIRKALDQQAR